MTIAPPPADLIRLLEPRKHQAAPRMNSTLPEEGSRNSSLASLGGLLRRMGYDYSTIEATLLAINQQFPEPLSDAEAASVAASMMRYDPAMDITEQAMSARFADVAKGQFAFDPAFKWLRFDGKRWCRDPGAYYVQERAKDLVQKLKDEVDTGHGLSPEEQKSLSQAARRTRSKPFIRNMMELASSNPALFSEGGWDEKRELINFQNGTLDLTTGSLREHDPADKLTKTLTFDYDPAASCPIFDKVLADALDQPAADFLMELFGYALEGTGDLQKMLLLIGAGRNGKSTIVEAIGNVLGDYATTADPISFMKSQNKPAINNDIAALRGARLILTSELNTGQTLDQALVKRMTGGEPLKARFLFGEYFTFHPRSLLTMVSNVVPVFDGSDFAMERRLIVIRFDKIIPEDAVDPKIPEKLKGEASGIMNRILQGLKRYQHSGLVIPETVRQITSALVKDGNQVQQFLEDRCKVVSNGRTMASEMYDAYVNWTFTAGMRPMSRPAFKAGLERTAKITQQRSAAGYYWPGLLLV